ncbi:MAG: ABC transporter ATP-binding protein [Anaerolineae bacterium]|uniref:ABC transporter ATP-binding protein n=1 Tax=Promineifilum sp. TaxID=2664178 RepID=UPI002411AC2C|nr:ABC transporter ATP-binding protein [Promineifilum sp.]MCW5846526.1 ABC transporter ATP-binding protein [Anaerolineae bacterium]
MNTPDFLALRDVGVTFADTGETALAGVSLTVSAGAFVALVGRSGVGKSTLLRIIGGLLRPTTGTVHLQGAAPADSPAPIGIVFQRDNLMPWRTVAENVRLPLELGAGKGRKGERADAPAPLHSSALVADALAMVGLAGQEDSYPAQLSGGMAQRVALARALVHRPALLLLDEPFGALDALTREHMADELLDIWQAHPVTVLMVTHSIGEAVLLADEVMVMNDRPGRITERIAIDLPRPRTMAIEATAAYQAYVAAVRGAIRA